MPKKVTSMVYDDTGERATLTFPNGRKLVLSGISVERAAIFMARHAEQFERTDCCLTTPADVGGYITREH
jgi:hypothetical protein